MYFTLHFFQKNVALHKDIVNLIEESCGSIPAKLQGLLSNLTETQMYFQECVISMQQAKCHSNELLLSMGELQETAACAQFPLIER